MGKLTQLILATQPEPGHDVSKVLNLSEFLKLLKEEEDYYPGEQHDTKLMITRLRKIFYDKWGWDTQLIRKAATIDQRYDVKIISNPKEMKITGAQDRRIGLYKNNQFHSKYRLVTYKNNDRVYGNSRLGQIPFIYQNDHQEIILKDGFYCDIAHVFAGLDALNNFQLVTPLPNWLAFLYKVLPYADSNVDVVTWLGDIATSARDFLFEYKQNGNKPLTTEAMQNIINIDAPGSDMLGNLDSYIIYKLYLTNKKSNLSLTQILDDYYDSKLSIEQFNKKRFEMFCLAVGLKGWDGHNFSNEKEWFKYYQKQLLNTTCFMIFSVMSFDFKNIFMVFKTWFGFYNNILKTDLLLKSFLESLKNLI